MGTYRAGVINLKSNGPKWCSTTAPTLTTQSEVTDSMAGNHITKRRNPRKELRANPSPPDIARFNQKTAPDPSGCIRWTGATNRKTGYGYLTFTSNGQRLHLTAHRFSYLVKAGGYIPAGIHIHHECEHPWCVNPDHLQITTPAKHMTELTPKSVGYINAHKSHCKWGHELSAENLDPDHHGRRRCRECRRQRNVRDRKTPIPQPRKHSDAEYIAFDPFLDCDRDVIITCRTVKILITREPQTCVSLSRGSHPIPPGTDARREAAQIDGSWGRYYYCIECCDREMQPGFWKSNEDPSRMRSEAQ